MLDLPGPRIAVLLSGLDSAALAMEICAAGGDAFPLYIRCGLRWEDEEVAAVHRFLAAARHERLHPLVELTVPTDDLYAGHWSIAGPVPDASSPDEEVYLPGRNAMLLAKSLLWCHQHDISVAAMATLAGNPFEDAKPEVLAQFAAVVGRMLGRPARVWLPYVTLTKAEVLHRGRHWPIHLAPSCLQPAEGQHCGVCNKCHERRTAFAAAGIPDRTTYRRSP